MIMSDHKFYANISKFHISYIYIFVLFHYFHQYFYNLGLLRFPNRAFNVFQKFYLSFNVYDFVFI